MEEVNRYMYCSEMLCWGGCPTARKRIVCRRKTLCGATQRTKSQTLHDVSAALSVHFVVSMLDSTTRSADARIPSYFKRELRVEHLVIPSSRVGSSK